MKKQMNSLSQCVIRKRELSLKVVRMVIVAIVVDQGLVEKIEREMIFLAQDARVAGKPTNGDRNLLSKKISEFLIFKFLNNI